MSADGSNGASYPAESVDAELFKRVESHEEQLAANRTDIQNLLSLSRTANGRISKLAERFYDFEELLKKVALKLGVT